MPKDELNAWQATECHNEFGISDSLVADVKSLVSEARPSVDTSTDNPAQDHNHTYAP